MRRADSDPRHSVGRRLARWAMRLAGGALALVVILALSGAAYQSLAVRRAMTAAPPPGELIEVGGHRLHLYCRGVGTPTVVLEAGLFGSSLDWWTVQSEVSATTRVCAYDRAGMGWSEPGPRPRDSQRIAGELRTLLDRAGEAGPYVLVGHSLGGFHVRVFAGRHPDAVAGVVLVDASHEDLVDRLPAEVREASERQMGWFAALPVMGRFGIARLVGLPMGMIGKYPEEVRGPAAAVGYRTAAFRAAADEGGASTASGAQAREAGPLPDVPLVVVAGNIERYEPQFLPPGMSRQEVAAIHDELQRDLARLSPRGTLIGAEASGHYVHLDQPELVIDAIRRVVEAARA